MKYDTYAQYDPKGLALAVPGLLTVWAGIQRLRDELVLVGGLVPHFICRHPETGSLPRPGTLDVDIGIALGASSGQYGSLRADLQAQGFRLSEKFPSRFEKIIPPYTLYLDFLVERPPATQGTAVVDDGVPANIFPGIDRALATARRQVVEGRDLFGATQRFEVPICEVGPYLALKLRAFAHRQAPKDAFDILYTFLHYDGGSDAVVAEFHAEAGSGSTAMPDALTCLRNHFRDEDSAAPVRAAYFVYGDVDTGETDDVATFRQQIRQDMVTLGRTFLAGI